jgi:hypothetical protein
MSAGTQLLFNVLFSRCLHKKRKRWADGTLKVLSNGWATIYDESATELASEKLPSSFTLQVRPVARRHSHARTMSVSM